jgi:hypothetical protein
MTDNMTSQIIDLSSWDTLPIRTCNTRTTEYVMLGRKAIPLFKVYVVVTIIIIIIIIIIICKVYVS